MSGNLQVDAIKSHCNLCLGLKNHAIVHSETTNWIEELGDAFGNSIYGGDEWAMLKCLGCDSIRMRHRHWYSEETDDLGNQIINEEFFPSSVSRQKPLWRRQLLPFNAYLHAYDPLFDEIYEALSAGSCRLATMGIRALAERVMIDQVGDHKSFEKNVRAFFAAGHVAPNQQRMFRDTLIEAGHAAMHRSFEPSSDAVNTLLDILEGIMHSIYYAPMLAEQVKKAIPPRP